MTIDDSERYLRLMLGGMKHAVRYWEDKDKEESDIEQTNVEAVKTALDTMRKYQKIEQIVSDFREYQKGISCGFGGATYMQMVREVVDNENAV